ncbi:MAG: o-succinylbenzoate synthase [SAR324 cluster bacterium]|nr:o-succinylbenzoate synthase [SAR324 cluster bacterium]
MKISSIQIFRYQLPFSKSIILAKKNFDFREGLLIRILDSEGQIGIGEIAPLPGFSLESLAESTSQSMKLAEMLVAQSIPRDLSVLQGAFQRWFSLPNLVSSVKFGFQMAVLNLLAAQSQIPVAQLISSEKPKTLSLTRLLSGTPDEILSKADKIAQSPFVSRVKLKVGRIGLDQEVDLVQEVRTRIGSKFLQLDANRSWDLATAVYFGRQVSDCELLYIEEPLKNPLECSEFTSQTGIGYALDETLQHPEYRFKMREGLVALVLKPTLSGGIETAKMIAEEALEHQVRAVISSSYESSLGLIMLANLAASRTFDVSVGLDTYDVFQYDLCHPEFLETEGRIPLQLLTGQPTIYEDRLELLWQKSKTKTSR